MSTNADSNAALLAVDALALLLKAGVSPSDERVRTLVSLVRLSSELSSSQCASADPSLQPGQPTPDVRQQPRAPGNPFVPDPAQRLLPHEYGQRALRAALPRDPLSAAPSAEKQDSEASLKADDSVAPTSAKDESPNLDVTPKDGKDAGQKDGSIFPAAKSRAELPHRAPPSVFRVAALETASSTTAEDRRRGEVIFRARAQIAAYRSLARMTDPAPEVLIASCGGRRPRATHVERPASASARETYDELLTSRERLLQSRLNFRKKELKDISATPLPSDLRRKSDLEAKALALLPLQRRMREGIMKAMHDALSSPSPLELGGDAAKFQRPKPEFVSLPAHLKDASGAVPSAIDYLTSDAKQRYRALEKRHREEVEELRLQRMAKFSAGLLTHAAAVRSFQHGRTQRDKRLHKDLDRHFRDRVREEDRRKKKEQQDRLRALRNNDEDEYLALLENTKNTRLLQLLRQTDEYLSQLGAQVEAQREAVFAEDKASEDLRNGTFEEHNTETEAGSGSGENGTDLPLASSNGEGGGDSVQAMRARRHQYYKITHTIKEPVTQPTILVGGTLKPYQIDGLEWMVSLYNNGLNGILADEMGLGKTIQTISLITYLVEVKENRGPFLIIVPLSTISNWVRELEAWAPSLGKVVYRGNPERRKRMQQVDMAGGEYNVVLTTYEFVVKDKNFLGRITWKYIIIDEGHRMKNAECKLALTLGAKYRSRNRLLLTGTPLQNNLTELWALMNFLLPTIFSSADTFETWFNAPFQATSLGGGAELNEEEQLLVISRLHQVLRPFMLRRLKTDVETQLPEKVESVLRCDMSIWQKVLYRQMTSKLGILSSGSVRTFNNVVMQLKKVCNHPYLFYSEEELMHVPRDFLVRAAGKFEMLEHALAKLRATGHRVLVFSQMTRALDYLEYFLSGMGVKHMRLDGTTKADDRQTMLEQFNAKDSEYFCFLLSTRAGGLGLNLQTADTVFIFDSDWNPMMDLQAQDRAHRIGQKNEVRVFRLITAGTVEEKILERANQKLHMDAQIIQAGQFNNQSSDIDRTEMLKEILQSHGKDGDDEDDVPPLEDLNRMLARSDKEFELFQEMDRTRLEKEQELGSSRLLTEEEELPSWVVHPETQDKDAKPGLFDEINLETHGRSRRKRSEVTYDDGLTEKEWVAAVERDGGVPEASRRKRRKLEDVSDEAVAEEVGPKPK